MSRVPVLAAAQLVARLRTASQNYAYVDSFVSALLREAADILEDQQAALEREHVGRLSDRETLTRERDEARARVVVLEQALRMERWMTSQLEDSRLKQAPPGDEAHGVRIVEG